MYRTKCIKGKYTCDEINISKEKWEKLIDEKDIFTGNSMSALLLLYNQPENKGTCYDIEMKYNLRRQSFNPIITGLAKRICKKLNIEIEGTDEENTYWIVLMEYGKYEQNKRKNHFEWKLRLELVETLDNYTYKLNKQGKNEEDDFELESIIEIPSGNKEGKKTVKFSTNYERSKENREAAIKINGTKCMVCGFDFEKTYGEIGRGFIEVHHIVPISELEQETVY